MKPKDLPICGLAAVQAVFQRDPAAVKRLFFDLETSRRAAEMASYLAKHKRVYRVVTPAELEKISGTMHHGGIVAIVAEAPLDSVTEKQLHEWAEQRAPLLILDRVGNSHNLGAVARSAAFFGLKHLILPDHPQQAWPSESAYRVSEGGLAQMKLWTVGDLPLFCGDLAQRYDVLGASASAQAKPITRWLSSRLRAGAKPIALILGNEEEGLAPEVAEACTELVHLPAPDHTVESLNVSVAAGILIWEIWGRRAVG